MSELTTVVLGGGIQAPQRRSKDFVEYLDKLQREEDAKNAKMMQPIQDSLRAIAAEQKGFWSRSAAELEQIPVNRLAGMTPDLNLPRIADEVIESYATNTRAAEDATAKIKAEIKNFLGSLTSRTGWVLSKDSEQKFLVFVRAQAVVHSVEVTQSSLDQMLLWILRGECLGDEVGYDESLRTVVEPPPESTPETMDDVLRTVDINSQDGSRRLKRATDREWATGFAPLVGEYYTYLRETYGIDLQDSDAKYLFGPGGLFEQRGWAITPANLNAARRVMSAQGKWVDSEGNPAITVQEHLDNQLQCGKIDRTLYMRECARFDRMGKLNRPAREVKGLFLN